MRRMIGQHSRDRRSGVSGRVMEKPHGRPRPLMRKLSKGRQNADGWVYRVVL